MESDGWKLVQVGEEKHFMKGLGRFSRDGWHRRLLLGQPGPCAPARPKNPRYSGRPTRATCCLGRVPDSSPRQSFNGWSAMLLLTYADYLTQGLSGGRPSPVLLTQLHRPALWPSRCSRSGLRWRIASPSSATAPL